MVARLKERGRDDLAGLRARVLRLAALGRIAKGDADHIVDKIDELDAFIIKMYETPDERERLSW
jgi:hypothetical protein